MNHRLIRYVFGVLLLMEAFFMMVSTGVAVWYHFACGDSDWWCLATAAVLTFLAGSGLWWSGRKREHGMEKRDGYLIVSLAWIIFSLFGMIPYLLYGTVDNLTDAFFEAMSGFTTTGSTILENIDIQPHGILFWRSMTHWLGGLGIVVFSLALLPLIGGTGANMMFDAETTGLGGSKLRPKIQGTARRLWGIYLMLTLVLTLLLVVGHMPVFDAVNVAMSTIATGGFAPHQASLAFYHSAYVEYIVAIFLFIASLNFALFYYAGIGRWKVFWRDEEFRWFVRIVLVFTLLFIVMTYAVRNVDWVSENQFVALGGDNPDFLTVLRMSFFHVMTIISSGGFQAEYFDYDAWGTLFWQPTFVLMMIGGCAGSTAGGMKVVRATVLVKSLRSDFTRMLHPRQVSIVKLNNRPVPTGTVYKVMAMFAVYVILVFLVNFVLLMLGLDSESAFGTALSTFSNTGPGLGLTGPAFTWASVPAAGKWLLSFAMLMGRLEIFTLLIVFTPLFWRKY